MDRTTSMTVMVILFGSVIAASVLFHGASEPSVTDVKELDFIDKATRDSLDYQDVVIVTLTSMYPTLVPSDIVFVRYINATDIDVDDVIAIYSPFGGERILLRRVIEKSEMSEGWVFRTKGDGYPDRDPWLLRESHIIGVIIAYQRDNVVTLLDN
jgi:signal peptidase I